MSRIFLSHSSFDEHQAVALKHWLAANGWDDVFLDVDPQRGIAAGDRWQEALRQAADHCEAVLFVVSPAWAQSKWCLAEYLLAKSLHKLIFGVVISDVPLSELPSEMTSQLQLCFLSGPGPTEIVRFRYRDAEREVAFLSEGLGKLRTGLQKAGLSADFFPWPPKDEPHRSPFRGLAPLDVQDTAVFFGRDVEILRGMDALRGLRDNPARRLFVILGASGTGKSSFLRAGLLPRLAREDRHFLPLPVVRPDTAPLSGERGLAHALTQVMRHLGLRSATLGEIKARLGAGADEFASILRSIQEAARARLVRSPGEPVPPAPTLVLPVDQSEELFNAAAGPEACRFLSLIAAIQRDAQHTSATSPTAVSLIVAFTIRSDRYEPLQTAPELEGLQTEVFDDLKPMSPTHFQEVITGPVRRAAAATGRLEIEPALVDRLVQDCAKGADTLPLLGLTLERLYHDFGSDGDLRLDEYAALGGLRKIVETKIESVLDPRREKCKHQLALLRSAFIPWLVSINPLNDQPMRRVARRSELPAESLPLLSAFVENRLLFEDWRQGEPVMEIAHEALFRQWELLALWLQDERVALKEADALERQAREWKESGEDESWLWRGQRLQDVAALAARPDFQKRLLPCAEFLARCRQQEDAERAKEVRIQAEKLQAAEQLAAAEQARAEEQKHAATRARRQSKLAAALAMLAILCAVVACFSYARARRDRLAAVNARQAATNALAVAQRNAVMSQAQALVAEARQVREARPLQSLLLASAAAETARRGLAGTPILPNAHQTLLEALANTGGRPLVGHNGIVSCLAASPDGHWVVSGSWDNTGRLWDLRANDPSTQSIVLKGHQDRIETVAFSPDNRWVATGSRDTTARLWDLRTAAPSTQSAVLKGHRLPVSAVAFSPDNRWLVTSGDRTARLWDLRAADPSAHALVLNGHEGSVTTVAFSPDNHWVATGSHDNTTRLWDLQAADPSAQPVVLKGHEGPVNAVAFSPHNRWLVTGSADNTARLWNLLTSGPVTQTIVLRGHTGPLATVGFSSDEHWLATGSLDKTARLWDLRAADPSAQAVVLRGHDEQIRAVVFSPDNRCLATGGYDATPRLWNLEAADPSARPVLLRGHEAMVFAVVFSPDNRRVVTGSWDKTVRLWDLRVTNSVARSVGEEGHEGEVFDLAFSSDNRWVATGSEDNAARLWDLRSDKVDARPVVLKGHEGLVNAAAFSLDNRRVVTGSDDKTARLWDLTASNQAAEPLVLRGHGDAVLAVALSSDNRLLTGSADETARLWDLRAADPCAKPIVLRGHEGSVNAVAISPDNRWALTGSDDKTALLWDLRADTPSVARIVLKGHDRPVNAVAFSSDNRWVLTGSDDNTARLWDLRAANPCAKPIVLKGHEGSVNAVAFSPDNQWVLTGSDDKTARLWDLRAADPSAQSIVLKGHEGSVDAVIFSPDNRLVVTGSDGMTVRRWLFQVEDLLVRARSTAGRNLSTNEWLTVMSGQPYFEIFPGLPIPMD